MSSPILVLAHGYLGFNTLGPIHYFNSIAPVLKSAGATEVLVTDVKPKGSVQDRSTELGQQIKDAYGTRKVHLLAHSMGGLDARYLVASGFANVASLTTLGSPFRGTFAADVAVNPAKLLQLSVPDLVAAITRYQAQLLVEWPFNVVSETQFAVAQLREAVKGLATGDYSQFASYFRGLFNIDDAALADLTTEKCRQRFPDDESDLKGLPAFSYAGVIAPARVSPALTIPAILLDATGQQNDGLVPLTSARMRNHKGTLTVDHLGLIGWTPTDVTGLYRQIYASIASVQ